MTLFGEIMKHYLPLLALLFAGYASTPAPHVGGCNHSHELPPLNLSADEKTLLESVSPQPQSALDYYMLLPTAVQGGSNQTRALDKLRSSG